MRIAELIERLKTLQEKDPDATVHVVGYSTIEVLGKGFAEPIGIG